MLASLRSVSLGALFIACAVVACGGSDGVGIESTATDPKDASADTAPGTDASTPDAAGPTGNDAGSDATTTSSCAPFATEGPAVTAIEMVATEAPPPTGGTIPQGKFHLHEVTLYTGPKGATNTIPVSLKATVMVSGNVVQQTLEGQANGQSTKERTDMTFVTSGSNVTFTRTCPAPSKTTGGTFSATTNGMTLFLKNDVGQTVGYRYAP